VAITGYFKFQDKDFCGVELPPFSKVVI
jgi:hypothetical protein